jgi:hypothetical protein
MGSDSTGNCLAFERAERRLTILDEDIADRLPGRFLDIAVRVEERDAQQPGEQRADGRLARARRPDQDRGWPARGWPARGWLTRGGLTRGWPAHAITSDSR